MRGVVVEIGKMEGDRRLDPTIPQSKVNCLIFTRRNIGPLVEKFPSCLNVVTSPTAMQQAIATLLPFNLLLYLILQ